MGRYKTSEDSENLVHEPLASYGHVSYFQWANKDISKQYIQRMLTSSKLSVSELIEILPISIDTYKRKAVFNPSVTEKVLEIEEVYRMGLEAFGDSFYQWMDTPNVALGGLKPKSYLVNSFGIRKLIEQIGRIEHGVLA